MLISKITESNYHQQTSKPRRDHCCSPITDRTRREGERGNLCVINQREWQQCSNVVFFFRKNVMLLMVSIIIIIITLLAFFYWRQSILSNQCVLRRYSTFCVNTRKKNDHHYRHHHRQVNWHSVRDVGHARTRRSSIDFVIYCNLLHYHLSTAHTKPVWH